MNAYVTSVLHRSPSANALLVYGKGANGKSYLIRQTANKYNIDLIEEYSFDIKYKDIMRKINTPSIIGHNMLGLHLIMTGKFNDEIRKIIAVAGKTHPVFIESENNLDVRKMNVHVLEIIRPDNNTIAKYLNVDDKIGKMIISLSESIGAAKLNLQRFSQSPKGVKNINAIMEQIDVNPEMAFGTALVNGYDCKLISKAGMLFQKRFDVANLDHIITSFAKSMKFKSEKSYNDKFWMHNATYNKRHNIVKKKKEEKPNIKFKKGKKIKKKKEEPIKRQRLII